MTLFAFTNLTIAFGEQSIYFYGVLSKLQKNDCPNFIESQNMWPAHHRGHGFAKNLEVSAERDCLCLPLPSKLAGCHVVKATRISNHSGSKVYPKRMGHCLD